MLLRLVLIAGLACVASPSFAQTHVSGYTRKDGTYVQPHVRSNPNATRSDNHGPSASSRSSFSSTYAPAYASPSARNKDHDGISNQDDADDDNDGLNDDYDSNP
jgi:hypothetical protein